MDAPDETRIDGGALQRIGSGSTGTVFALSGGRVLKRAAAGVLPGVVTREYAAARVAHGAGLRTPRPIALAVHEGLAAIIYERVEGPSALARIARAPWRAGEAVARLAQYQARMHQVVLADDALPTTHLVLHNRIAESTLGTAAIAAAHRRLDALPAGDRLGHGDFHLGNVVVIDGRRFAAIDWSQAMIGDPAADVARTELLLLYASYGATLRRWRVLRAWRHVAAWWYVAWYRHRTGMARAAILRWQLPVAVAWAREGTAAHLPSLRRRVSRLIREEGA